jgi:hypothetical protein
MKKYFYSLLATLLFVQSTLVAQIDDSSRSIWNKDVVSVFPQPSTGQVNFSFPSQLTNNPKAVVYDLLGNVIAQIEMDRQNANTFSINLSDKKPGYYFVKIQTEGSSYSRRVTIRQ